MKNSFLKLSVIASLLVATAALAQDKVPLKTDLPPPLFVGTPVPIGNIPNLDPAPTKWPEFLVPAGTTNLALNKKVTSSVSDSDIITGTLDLVTDGDKGGDEGSWVELPPGKQWVQIDLGQEANIYAITVWHYHSQKRVYHDVVVQISDDPTFSKDVTTVFDNSSSGSDHPYIESNFGKLIDGKGTKGRYVRLYSNGNTTNKMNHYIEVEVFGKPAA
ncbi:MAG TPA: discoidin domain-containing protein [Verrucomicrobiae bacterium]|nr:discoidin domain-containing protein [Verrucomicrobiae bacterium]